VTGRHALRLPSLEATWHRPRRVPAPREIELKLEVDPSQLARIKRRLSQLSVREPVTHTLVSVYFDTPRWTLRKHRLSLRVRRIGRQFVQTVKSADGRAAGLYDRAEWEHRIHGSQPELSWTTDTALGPLLHGKLARSLRPLFETRVRRTEYWLARPGAVISAALDHGTVRAGSRHCTVCEIELELSQGRAAALFSLAEALGKVAPMDLSVKTKADRGYGLLQGNANPAPKPPRSVRVLPTATAGAAFQAIARGCLLDLIANEKSVVAGDAQALHRMRIALRRLRAAIGVFSEMLRDRQLARIESELRWIGAQLGPARDLDVFIAEMVSPLRAQHHNDRRTSRICRHFEHRRAVAYRRVAASLQSPRLRHLKLDLTRWIEAGPWLTSRTGAASRRRDEPVSELAVEELTRLRKKLRRKGKRLAKLSRQDRHRVRIRAKKLRCAVEFFAALFPGKKRAVRCRQTLSALADLKDALGALNDLARRETFWAHETPTTALSGGPSTRNGAAPKAFTTRVSFAAQKARVVHLLRQAERAFKRFRAIKPFWE
jgi:triphosphatase